ncbi:hypothetical protein OC845_006345 [Tilletia horrida]|nr:hypothetical protein OC845_006345 [Tilletia horrida]
MSQPLDLHSELITQAIRDAFSQDSEQALTLICAVIARLAPSSVQDLAHALFDTATSSNTLQSPSIMRLGRGRRMNALPGTTSTLRDYENDRVLPRSNELDPPSTPPNLSHSSSIFGALNAPSQSQHGLSSNAKAANDQADPRPNAESANDQADTTDDATAPGQPSTTHDSRADSSNDQSAERVIDNLRDGEFDQDVLMDDAVFPTTDSWLDQAALSSLDKQPLPTTTDDPNPVSAYQSAPPSPSNVNAAFHRDGTPPSAQRPRSTSERIEDDPSTELAPPKVTASNAGSAFDRGDTLLAPEGATASNAGSAFDRGDTPRSDRNPLHARDASEEDPIPSSQQLTSSLIQQLFLDEDTPEGDDEIADQGNSDASRVNLPDSRGHKSPVRLRARQVSPGTHNAGLPLELEIPGTHANFGAPLFPHTGADQYIPRMADPEQDPEQEEEEAPPAEAAPEEVMHPSPAKPCIDVTPGRASRPERGNALPFWSASSSKRGRDGKRKQPASEDSPAIDVSAGEERSGSSDAAPARKRVTRVSPTPSAEDFSQDDVTMASPEQDPFADPRALWLGIRRDVAPPPAPREATPVQRVTAPLRSNCTYLLDTHADGSVVLSDAFKEAASIILDICAKGPADPSRLADEAFLLLLPLEYLSEMNRDDPSAQANDTQWTQGARNVERSHRFTTSRWLQELIDCCDFAQAHRRATLEAERDPVKKDRLEETIARYGRDSLSNFPDAEVKNDAGPVRTGRSMNPDVHVGIGIKLQGIATILGSLAFLPFLLLSPRFGSAGRIRRLNNTTLSALSLLLRGGRPEMEELSASERQFAEAAIFAANVVLPYALRWFLASAARAYDERALTGRTTRLHSGQDGTQARSSALYAVEHSNTVTEDRVTLPQPVLLRQDSQGNQLRPLAFGLMGLGLGVRRGSRNFWVVLWKNDIKQSCRTDDSASFRQPALTSTPYSEPS